MRHAIKVVAIVLALWFLLYTVPRWIFGWGFDMFPAL